MSSSVAASLPLDVKPSTSSSAGSLLGALVALGGFPFGFILYNATATRTDDSVEAFADRFNEGGAAMYVLVSVAALAALVGALGAFLAPRGRLAVWAGSAVLPLAMTVLGAISYGSRAVGALKAVGHSAPELRGTIMRGFVGELTQVLILVAALVSALFVTQGVALILGWVVAKEAALRKTLLLLGVGLLAVGAWQGFSAMELAGERAALQAFAHAAPIDRLSQVVEGFDRMASNRQFGLVPLLLALVVAAAGAVVLRADRRRAATVLFGILVPVVVLSGARAAAQVDSFGRELLALPDFDRELLVLDAPPAELRGTRLTVGNELLGAHGSDPELGSLAGAEISLGLEPGVTMESLVKALRQLRAARVATVTLIGTKKTPPSASVPELYAPLFDEARGLRLGLASRSDCDGGCETAKLDERGITWRDRTWPLKTSSVFEAYETTSIPLSAEGLTLESLLSACHSVVGDGGKIVLVLPE